MDFFWVRPHTLSTFSAEQVKQSQSQGFHLEKTLPIEIWPLGEVLRLHQNHFAQPVDILCIDVEGWEVEVLNSSDWTRHRPRFVLIEKNHNPELIHQRMIGNGYHLLFDNGTNGLYAPTHSRFHILIICTD